MGASPGLREQRCRSQQPPLGGGGLATLGGRAPVSAAPSSGHRGRCPLSLPLPILGRGCQLALHRGHVSPGSRLRTRRTAPSESSPPLPLRPRRKHEASTRAAVPSLPLWTRTSTHTEPLVSVSKAGAPLPQRRTARGGLAPDHRPRPRALRPAGPSLSGLT